MGLTKYDIERFDEYMVNYFMKNDKMMSKFLQKLLDKKSDLSHTNLEIVEKDNQLEPQVIEKVIEVPVEKIIEVEKIVYQDRIVETPVETVPSWVDDLVPFIEELEFFDQVKNEPDVANILLPDQSNNIKRLVINASQWNNILRIWDELANQVKTKKNAISTNQMAILIHCLALFNLTLINRQAKLHSPSIADNYDYEIHEKVIGSSDRIIEILLPSLYNAGNEQVRPALVVTQ